MRAAPVSGRLDASGALAARPASVRVRPLPREVTLRYLHGQPIRVRGAATGRLYPIPAHVREIDVDVRDVAGLLRTRYFAR